MQQAGAADLGIASFDFQVESCKKKIFARCWRIKKSRCILQGFADRSEAMQAIVERRWRYALRAVK